MNLQPMNQQPISDDQELAKVLAGVNGASDDQAADTPQIETTMIPTPQAPAADTTASSATSTDEAVADPAVETPEAPELPAMPEMPDMSAMTSGSGDAGDLDSIKQTALNELRPLVDKLDVAPEEKFDTYLLLLRSTDDKSLIAPAHEAAKSIADEARRAQALLDIIKEIDFLSQPAQ